MGRFSLPYEMTFQKKKSIGDSFIANVDCVLSQIYRIFFKFERMFLEETKTKSKT